MRSSDIARIADVSVRALRHYHAIGLLPEPPRAENGYREYGVMDLTRVLHIKRLAALGFSLSQIKEILDESDPAEADTTKSPTTNESDASPAPSAETSALLKLDRELELQIQQLQRKRKIISQLLEEQLDPSLPIRFAHAVKKFYSKRMDESDKHATPGEHAILLLASHLYDEASLLELERVADAAIELDVLDSLYEVERMIDELEPDAPEKKRRELVDFSMKALEPLIVYFDSSNWEESANDEIMQLLESLASDLRNPAQYDVESRIETEIIARIRPS